MATTKVTTGGITAATIAPAEIADQAVTLDKLPHGTGSNNGKFLRANNGADPTFETVNTDLSADTSPQLGGDLDTNGNDIIVTDNNLIKYGTGGDLLISHNGTNSTIQNLTGVLRVRSVGELQITKSHTENMAKFIPDGAVELYHDNVKKFETASHGCFFDGTGGDSYWYDGSGGNDLKWLNTDNVKTCYGTGSDLQIYHNGTNSYINNATGALAITGDDLNFENAARNETYIECDNGAAVKLYYDNEKMFQTNQDGAEFFDSDSNLNVYFSTNGSTRRGYIFAESTNGGKLSFYDPQNHPMLSCTKDGPVELYYDNSKKFETISTGIQTVEAVKMTHGGNAVNLKLVYEAGIGNTASTTATVPEGVGGGTVTVTTMHNGNHSICTTKMFPIMIRGNSAANLGSEIFSINHLSSSSMSVNAATLGVTVTNNAGAHAKVRITFDLTYNG